MGFFDLFKRRKNSLLEKLEYDEQVIKGKQQPNPDEARPNNEVVQPNQNASIEGETGFGDKLTSIDNKLDRVIDILKASTEERKMGHIQNTGETKNASIDKILTNLMYLNSRLDRVLTKAPNAPNTDLTEEKSEKADIGISDSSQENLTMPEKEHFESDHLTLRLKQVIEVIKEEKTITPTELAEQLRIKRPSAYELLQKLVAMNIAVDNQGTYSLKPKNGVVASTVALIAVVYFLIFIMRIKSISPTSQAILVSNMNPNFLIAGIFSMIIAAVFIFAATRKK